MSSTGVVFLVLIVGVAASVVTMIVRGISRGREADAEAQKLRQNRKAAGPVEGLVIRPLASVDRVAWGRHWASYCDFYSADLPASTTETTWGRLVDPHSPVKGWGAFSPSGDLLGFAHTVLHPHTWSPKQLCYLEDLFVAQPFRGRDIGHALIQFLWQKSEQEGWGRLYWHTEGTNAAARRLYDRFRPADGYVRYTLTL